jgi:zinc/manganese transport system substrate-binding protein
MTERDDVIRIALASAALIGLVAGCGSDAGEGDSAGVSVSASTTELADIAANVADEGAEVTGILPRNADAHEFEPQPSDAESVADADLVLQSGGDIDLWLDEVVESSGTDAPVLNMIDSVRTIEGTGEEEGDVDPHWWQDPANAIIATEQIRDRLSELDPEGRDVYEENAGAYIERLRELDRRIADCMSEVPAEQRKLVTSHDALGYFAERYDVEVVGAIIPALTTQAQPSAGETAELVELIEAENVNAVFPEAGVSAALEESVAEETGAEIGGELWADTLGPEGSSGATYLEAMAHNAVELAAGFTGRDGACRIDVSA